ncbi:MAG: hypothetical protein BZ137_03055 [Methanosphaera sp. rholeuAM130]|nr:MAG: hypothetical protein BZ137_03055 [Methanosphaera sp. rholeuAM130]
MDFGYIIKDAFKYPLSDSKKLVILAIPAIVLQVMSFAMNFMGLSSGEIDYYMESASAMDSGMIIGILLLFMLVTLFVTLINYGIHIETIKKSFNSSQLPDFDIQRFFVSGLKALIVRLGYIVIPFIIFAVAWFALMFLSDSSYGDMNIIIGLAMLLLIIIGFVLFIVLAVMEFVADARLAQTNSLSEAFDVKNIIDIAKEIGMFNILGIEIVFGIIATLIIIVFAILSLIPLIGSVILAVATTYILLASARMISLVYQSRLVPQNNNMYPQSVPNYQSRFADDSTNQMQGGYYPPQQGYGQPNQGYPPNLGSYQPQDFNQSGQGYSQPQNQYSQPSSNGNNQGYDNDNQNINQNSNNQAFTEDDSIINGRQDNNQNNPDIKNADSSEDDKSSEN